MRVASRVIGIVLVLAGLIFVSLGILFLFQFRPQSVLAGPAFGRVAWTGAASAAFLGVGLLLAGWYYFKLDVDALDDIEKRPTSRFALYFLAHRRELKRIAQMGLVISLIQLGAACFGVDWLGRWGAWILVLVLCGLVATEGKNARVSTAAEQLPKPIGWAAGVAFLILALVCMGSEYLHRVDASRISGAALITLCFAREALKS